MHGFGSLQLKSDNSIYEGNFEYGVKQGWGILKWKDGSKVEGFWNKGKLDHCVRIKFKIYRVFIIGVMGESTWVNGVKLDLMESDTIPGRTVKAT